LKKNARGDDEVFRKQGISLAPPPKPSENHPFYPAAPVKTTLLLILGAILAFAEPALAVSEVVVLQSSRLAPFEQARQGLERVLSEQPLARGVKHIHSGELSVFVLSEEPDRHSLKSRILKENPALLVTIGGQALALAGDFPAIPVIYLLTADPGLAGSHPAMTGVNMTIPPPLQLVQFARALPTARRVGMIYDPEQSEKLIAEARTNATKLGIELIAEPARGIGAVPALLAGLRGRIDAFWLLPDPVVLTPRSLQEILLFSFRNNIPVLSFSSRYLDDGAAMAIVCDPAGMGEQAGGLVREILRNKNNVRRGPILPEAELVVNHKILKKMGISLPAGIAEHKDKSP
jgi:putative tryptophan/tyrosine transport system substrate-binding protein